MDNNYLHTHTYTNSNDEFRHFAKPSTVDCVVLDGRDTHIPTAATT